VTATLYKSHCKENRLPNAEKDKTRTPIKTEHHVQNNNLNIQIPGDGRILLILTTEDIGDDLE